MTANTPRVTCIGLANVDVIANVSENFITTHNIAKGATSLLDSCLTGSLLGLLDRPAFAPGGCAANTTCGIASFGHAVRFVGKVGDDSYAEIFRQGFSAYPMISFDTKPYAQKMTSTCVTLVTPDKDRSFAICPDTSGWFVQAEDLPEIDASDDHVIYLEANTATMLTGQDGKSIAQEIVEKYGNTKNRIIINLNDREIVHNAKAVLSALTARDIAFFIGNVQEICALFDVADFDAACDAIYKTGKTFLVTNGAEGAYILKDGQKTHVPAKELPQSRIVNTLGAGDQFAAGFIAGLIEGRSLEEACSQGIEAAATIIQQLSARPKVKKTAA